MSAPSSSRRYLLAGLATAGLVGGGAVVANAASVDSAAAPSTTSSTSAAPSRPTPPTPRPHLDGTVLSASAGTITVKDHDGFTRTIEVGAGTTYTLAGKSSKLAAVVRGRFVHADGSVDGNGTSLDATRVAVMTSAPKPGTGPDGRGPRGRGPGGPAGPAGPVGLPAPGKAGGKAPAGGKASAGGTAPQAPTGAPSASTPSPSTTAHGS